MKIERDFRLIKINFIVVLSVLIPAILFAAPICSQNEDEFYDCSISGSFFNTSMTDTKSFLRYSYLLMKE